MTERRLVRVTEQFFDRLDDLFPEVRTVEGDPSAADFLLHELPNVIEKLATDFESAAMLTGGEPDVRVLIAAGLLVPYYGVYAALVEDGSVEIFWLDID